MKRLLLAGLLLTGNEVRAETSNCQQYGLYAFALIGCPEQTLKVNVTIPLCEQEQWRHLSNYDYRCYKALPIDESRTDWLAPTPYQKQWVEPITGAVRTFAGSYSEADGYYRACRETLGTLKRKGTKPK